jgi:hypothetical protein
MWPFRRRRYTLLTMRLANMFVGHPDMVTDRVCPRCGETVGIYPSGQRLLAKKGNRVDLICEVCYGPVDDEARPLPGVERERAESRWLNAR